MGTTKVKFKTVDEYICTFADDVQEKLKSIRQAVKQAAPGTEERISYNIPSFHYKGLYLLYYGAWKKHIGLYPVSTAMEASIKELSTYKTSGKGTVQFPMDKPMPLSLIKKIVKYRMKENLERKQKR